MREVKAYLSDNDQLHHTEIEAKAADANCRVAALIEECTFGGVFHFDEFVNIVRDHTQLKQDVINLLEDKL